MDLKQIGWACFGAALVTSAGLCVYRRQVILDFLLMSAAAMGRAGAVRMLLAWGANPNAWDQTYSSAQLVDQQDRSSETTSPRQSRNTVLILAAAAGNPEVIEVLLARGAEVNAGNADGLTPLMMAALVNSAEAVHALLSGGAAVNQRNCNGDTALSIARAQGNDRMAYILASAGGSEC
jgi:uncharacterized protein